MRKKKSKVGAVLLAVFLGYWTWVYTYNRGDAWKFWLGIALCFTGMFMLFIPNIAVWIWSIVDTARRPDEWYNYTKKYKKLEEE